MNLSILSICLLLCATISVVSGAGRPRENANVTICDVKDFGAVGDGQTDDSAAVQTAMAACEKSAQSGLLVLVYFPLGSYKLISNASTTFESAFFFQLCNNATNNAVSFTGEVDESTGNRAQISWFVDTLVSQAMLFKVTTCSNFAVNNLDIQVHTQTVTQAVIASVEGTAGVTISDVHWSTAPGTSQYYAIALSIEFASNILIQNAVFEDSLTLALLFSECSDVAILDTTVRGIVSSNTTGGISVEGGSNFQFEDLTVVETVTGIVFWSEIQANAAATISHATFAVTSEAISVYNNIILTITDVAFTNSDISPAALYGISLGRAAQPCITISNSTFSNFGAAAIQNVNSDSNVASQQQQPSARIRKGSDDCRFLTIQNSNFEFNKIDLEIQGSNWQITNNTCAGNEPSLLTCLGNFCDESNNQGCDFTSGMKTLNQPSQRSSTVILTEV